MVWFITVLCMTIVSMDLVIFTIKMEKDFKVNSVMGKCMAKVFIITRMILLKERGNGKGGNSLVDLNYNYLVVIN